MWQMMMYDVPTTQFSYMAGIYTHSPDSILHSYNLIGSYAVFIITTTLATTLILLSVYF